jgi:hypothetical protein
MKSVIKFKITALELSEERGGGQIAIIKDAMPTKA